MTFLLFLSAIAQIVLIDIAMSADNAIAIGMAASGLPSRQRHGAVIGGIISATLLRIAFATLAVQLMHIAGLLAAGGLLLLWIAWRMYQDVQHMRRVKFGEHSAPDTKPDSLSPATAEPNRTNDFVYPQTKTLAQAIIQVVIADISLSLDNVLAVAGVARDHWLILAAGLALSVLLTGVASALVARLTARHAWIGYLGLAVVIYTAGKMIWDGIHTLGVG